MMADIDNGHDTDGLCGGIFIDDAFELIVKDRLAASGINSAINPP
jgi:hypothetical protein